MHKNTAYQLYNSAYQEKTLVTRGIINLVINLYYSPQCQHIAIHAVSQINTGRSSGAFLEDVIAVYEQVVSNRDVYLYLNNRKAR